jgi:hypothetical protein
VKFWKSELKIPEGKSIVKYTMRTAWRTFPHWHSIVYRPTDATPVRTKKDMEKLISNYICPESKPHQHSLCSTSSANWNSMKVGATAEGKEATKAALLK